MQRIIQDRTFCILAVLLCSFLQTSEAQRINLPYVDRNVCPFECCQFGRWITKSPLKVYENEGDTTALKFEIVPGDSFIAVSGNVHIMRPGVVMITKPHGKFSPGDTLYTLTYFGEGSIDIWYHDSVENVQRFWYVDPLDGPPDFKNPRLGRYPGVLVSKALMVWWVKIAYRNGQGGWLRFVNTTDAGFDFDEDIDGLDACS